MDNKKTPAKSSLLTNIDIGIQKNILSIADDKITYQCSKEGGYTTSYKNPEEKVRASVFVDLVLKYNYPQKKIVFEKEVPHRVPSIRADIVVYEDDELKKPYLVVECKKDGITDAEFTQAIEQAFGYANTLGAKYTAVVAGMSSTVFNVKGFKSGEREKNVIADIPEKYGNPLKYRFSKGDEKNDLTAVSKDELIRALEKSHDTVWQGGKLAPTAAFDEVSKLLFCKLKDEKDTKNGDNYAFQIGTGESRQQVADRIIAIYAKARLQDAEVFREGIRLEPEIIYSVIEHIQKIAFVKTDLDSKGVAFEKFMEDFFKGKMGQFFTPREVIEFAVNLMNPQKDDLVIDPASGSGGFLLYAMDNVRKQSEADYDEREAFNHWHGFAKNNLYGIEINDQIARVCKMNMIIHDDGHTNVINTDGLQEIDNITAKHNKFKKDYFDMVLTNPPFGATIKKTEKDYIEKYELGKDKKQQKTEILFIERVIDFIKPETGRIAIVLPDGILTNSTMQYVRDYIMEHCQILAVVSLPQHTFSHYGAGVKASLVFLRRKGNNETLPADYPIFMAIADQIGYDATGRKMDQNDLDIILEQYNNFVSNPAAFH